MNKLKQWFILLYLKYLVHQRDKNFYKSVGNPDRRLQLKATHKWFIFSDKAYTLAQEHNLQQYL